MDEPKPSCEVIGYNQNMIFGLYEPENERKVQLDLVIDRNDFTKPTMYRRGQEEVRI